MSVVDLATVNGLDETAFVAAFGDVAEHSPWVAEGASRLRPFRDVAAMAEAFAAAIATAAPDAQLALLRAHPDLAGRAAIAGDLAPESKSEQAGVGLDRLTADEFARFTDVNTRYVARFGFPFIFAVKGATKHMILAAFDDRIGRAPADELRMALAQVMRIVRFRIEGRVVP